MAFFHSSQNPYIQNLSNSDNHNNNNNNNNQNNSDNNNSYYDHHHQYHHPNRAVLTHNIGDEDKIIQKCTKRKRNNEADKSEQVIQVRAKRGQATDSHSLAERERRKKINERLKCLQTIVPGCYETMGMAMMLDAVISYVQSLQNQIEFLSMKLSAASMYYDSNMMQGTNSVHHETNDKIDKAEGFGGFCQNFQ